MLMLLWGDMEFATVLDWIIEHIFNIINNVPSIQKFL